MRAKGNSASSVQSKQIIKVWGRQKKKKKIKGVEAFQCFQKKHSGVFSGSADTCLLRHSPGETSGSIYPSIFKPGCSHRGGTKPWGGAGASSGVPNIPRPIFPNQSQTLGHPWPQARVGRPGGARCPLGMERAPSRAGQGAPTPAPHRAACTSLFK